MVEVKDVYEVKEVRGKASTLKREEFQLYGERVGKFIQDNASLGDKWVKKVGKLLYTPLNMKKGEVVGSNPYIGVAMASLCPEIPVITGKQLLGMYELAGEKNPFGSYIDFGVQVNGTLEVDPVINKVQAKALQESYDNRGIDLNESWVPDFKQLVLKADKGEGLVFSLAEDVKQQDLAHKEDYPFSWFGENGLFGAYLDRNGDWIGSYDDLSDSFDDGRVVRYDAEGVAPVSLPVTPEKDLATKLKEGFLNK